MTKADLMKWLIILAVATTTTVPALSADQVPSCDLFRERFARAPRVLSLRLPNSRFYREPPNRYSSTKHDVWKTEATRSTDGELWYTTGLYCVGPKFDYVAADIDAPNSSLHPTFDLVAASIYAFTGWEADKVVQVANEVLKDRPTGYVGDFKTVELRPGAYAQIETVGFSITLDKTPSQ
jgi:hypothetical protein